MQEALEEIEKRASWCTNVTRVNLPTITSTVLSLDILIIEACDSVAFFLRPSIYLLLLGQIDHTNRENLEEGLRVYRKR